MIWKADPTPRMEGTICFMERPIELTVLERDLQAALIAFDPASKPFVLNTVSMIIASQIFIHHL